MAPPKDIKQIDPNAVRLICSGQGIPDLATGVKELVENAMDANATKIEIRLKNYGKESFEVIDDGDGIPCSDFENLCLKHYTSKISKFNDLEGVESYGFRGEALSSLCELSQSLLITTRVKENPVASKLEFHSNGKLKKQSPVGRAVGTTVVVEKLFAPLAVRRKEYERNIKKQYAKLLHVLQAYSLIATKVRISCVNFVSSKRNNVMSTKGAANIGQNVTSVFGAKFLSELVAVDFTFRLSSPVGTRKIKEKLSQDTVTSTDTASQDEDEASEPGPEVRIHGLVSKAGNGIGRNNSDRQFFYVNRRPVDLSRPTKAINDVWRQFEMKHKPAFVLNMEVQRGYFDVNVTPDKRQVLITNENEIIDKLSAEMRVLWEPSRNVFVARRIDDIMNSQDAICNKPLTSSVADGKPSQDPMHAPAVVPPSSPNAPLAPPPDAFYIDSQTNSLSVTDSVQSGRSAAEAQAELTMDDWPTSVRPGVESQSDASQITGTTPPTQPPETANHDAAPEDDPGPCGGGSERESTTVGDQTGHEPFHAKDPEDGDGESQPRTATKPAGLRSANSPDLRSANSPDLRSANSLDRARDPPPREKEPLSSPTKQVSNARRTKRAAKKSLSPEPRNPTSAPGALDEDFKEHGGSPGRKRRRTQRRVPKFKRAKMKLQVGSLESVHNNFRRRWLTSESNTTTGGKRNFSHSLTKGVEDDQESATRELERSFSKSDFVKAHILGQFNLGFIIARVNSDLFILDQHACDEKYRFEGLQKTTKIHEQDLIRPLPIDLSAAEQQTIMDNLDIFAANGFKFKTASDATFAQQQSGQQHNGGQRLFLVTIPHSFKTQFGEHDVRELASVLRDAPPPRPENRGDNFAIPRIPRMRSMFASRACRGAIMIGKHLSHKEMTTVVHKMTGLDQPWNCPHGRPTMRHLVNLGELCDKHHGNESLGSYLDNTKMNAA